MDHAGPDFLTRHLGKGRGLGRGPSAAALACGWSAAGGRQILGATNTREGAGRPLRISAHKRDACAAVFSPAVHLFAPFLGILGRGHWQRRLQGFLKVQQGSRSRVPCALSITYRLHVAMHDGHVYVPAHVVIRGPAHVPEHPKSTDSSGLFHRRGFLFECSRG